MIIIFYNKDSKEIAFFMPKDVDGIHSCHNYIKAVSMNGNCDGLYYKNIRDIGHMFYKTEIYDGYEYYLMMY